MYSLGQEIRDKYANPMDEDRVWVAGYGRSVNAPLSEIRAVVEDYADRIEDTYSAVTNIEEIESGRVGIDDHSQVALVIVISRSADKDLFDDSMQCVDGKIRHAVHELV